MENENKIRKYLNTCKRIVIKIGTNVLTSAKDGIDLNILSKLCKQISDLHNGNKEIIVVTSGAIGTGKSQLKISKNKLPLNMQQVTAAVGQSLLMEQYNKFFRKRGKVIAQILLARDDFKEEKHIYTLCNTLKTLFQLRVIPIINENDAVFTEELDVSHDKNVKLFSDNDILSSFVAVSTYSDVLIILSDVDGLLEKENNLISFIEKIDEEIEELDKGNCNIGGRGGFSTKFKAMQTITERGIVGIIANGKTPNILNKIFSGKKIGTVFNRKTVQKRIAENYSAEIAMRAKEAGIILAHSNEKKRDNALIYMAELIEKNTIRLLEENKKDLTEAKKNNASDAFMARLTLSEKSINYLSSTLRKIANFTQIKKELANWNVENGLQIKKVRVPLGVICIIFESRPDVIVEACALAIKSGNAIILKGGKEANYTNYFLTNILKKGLTQAKLEQNIIQLFSGTREDLAILLKRNDCIDLVIPRGGKGLIQFVSENSTIPVIFAGGGNCHIYVHNDADIQMAINIIINAKVQKPSACNAIETLLVHEKIAPIFLPLVAKTLIENQVEIRCCPISMKILQNFSPKPATENDWITEFLGLILAIKVVSSIDEAIKHINKYGTKHSEAIITQNRKIYEDFAKEIDASAIYWNTSTRFTDGGQFGFGAELGISTQKLHVRGPISVDALYTYKYKIIGKGQIRE